MRIAHITATFPPYLAGTGYVAYYQARELAKLGHTVRVYSAASERQPETDPPGGVEIVRLPALVRIGNAPLLPGLLRLQQFDIVHLHYPFISGAEFAWWACRRRKIPYVVNYHNDLIGIGPRKYVFDAYTRLFGGLVLGQAALILAVTRDHAMNCRATPIFQRYNRSIVEVNNGVDIDHFHPGWDGLALRTNLGIAPHKQVILFVGALDQAHHFKGVSVLLEAYRQVRDERTHLVIVGDGDLRQAYQAEAESLGINTDISFAGRISHADLPAYYAAADLVVLPSSPPESFGMVIIEAMACGRPVIGSRIPGVRSLVDEERDGLLTEPGDPADLAIKLAHLLKLSPTERQAMGMRGRRKAESQFSWHAIAHKLEQCYEQVLGE